MSPVPEEESKNDADSLEETGKTPQLEVGLLSIVVCKCVVLPSAAWKAGNPQPPFSARVPLSLTPGPPPSPSPPARRPCCQFDGRILRARIMSRSGP